MNPIRARKYMRCILKYFGMNLIFIEIARNPVMGIWSVRLVHGRAGRSEGLPARGVIWPC
ncbi:hypothetical protein BCEP4_320010 [Burkholderia cepacia]|nr:hypothetical protein BCEP4_320010 [Burkholderia cepacia]